MAILHIDYPLIENDILTIINNKEYQIGYDENRLRIDWILNRCEDFEGLVLCEEFDIETTRKGIISNTYYCA